MTQPGLLGMVFGLRGRITGISWLPRSLLLRLPSARQTTAPSWNIRRGGGKFALPQTLYLAAITREYLSSYPGKALMQCAMKAPPAAACVHCTPEAFPRAQAVTGI